MAGSLFFKGNKDEESDEPRPVAQRRSTRGHDRYLTRQQRKSRKRGARKAFDDRRRAETLEAQRRILTGEVQVSEAVRRNVENHYRRLMEQQESADA